MKTYNHYNTIVRSVYGGPRNSFWSGFASLLSLAGARKNGQPGRRLRSEADALSQDWSNVSRDLQHAFHRAGCR